MKLIDKDAALAELERRYEINLVGTHSAFRNGKIEALRETKDFLNTLEVKETETWHLQEKEDIYDAVKDWSLHTFVCVMKDGSIQEFTGNRDEDCEGHINVHIDGINDDYDNVDDIVKWIEYT